MKKIIITSFIAILILTGLGFLFYPKTVVQPVYKPVETVEKRDCSYNKDKLLVAVNNIRQTPMKEDEKLDALAQERATALNGQLDEHKGFYPIAESGRYKEYSYIGENLAKTICPPDSINLWLSSPPHRATLLGDYKFIGLAEKNGIVVMEVAR